jgi:DNA-binding NarL/FixJ family response regulator
LSWFACCATDASCSSRSGFRWACICSSSRCSEAAPASAVCGLAAAALAEGQSPLSPRERDVLAAAGDGATIAEIAARLHLSEGTVRNHLSAAIQKLAVDNRMEAVQLARAKGWL